MHLPSFLLLWAVLSSDLSKETLLGNHIIDPLNPKEHSKVHCILLFHSLRIASKQETNTTVLSKTKLF